MAAQVGRRAYGSIIALQGVPVAVAAGAGPVVAGVLYDHLGGYTVSFSLCAGAFLLAAALFALPPRPPGSQSRLPAAIARDVPRSVCAEKCNQAGHSIRRALTAPEPGSQRRCQPRYCRMRHRLLRR